MSGLRVPPLVFVDEYGQANLDVENPDIGARFILTAVLVEPGDETLVRDGVEAVRSEFCQTGELRSKKLARRDPEDHREVLRRLAQLPFRFWALVVDKREISVDSGLAYKHSFYKFLSAQLYRELFDTFPNVHVVADEFGREKFMDEFAEYLIKNHRLDLFNQPRVSFANSKKEPLVQLADVVCGALARTYDRHKTTEASTELLRIIKPRARMIIEWPLRFRAVMGTGTLRAGDPQDDDVAAHCLARAGAFIERYRGDLEEQRRAQVRVLERLVYEVQFEDRASYVPTVVLTEVLRQIGANSGEQFLRSSVIAKLRDAGVVIASSSRGYKIPVSVRDVASFVELTDNVVHPMLNRVGRARASVLEITGGRVDVLGGGRLAALRAAVEASAIVPLDCGVAADDADV